MKILVYEWNGFGQKDLREALERMGHRAERMGYVLQEKCGDAFFEEKLARWLKRGYDCVISFNFFPPVAKCCQEAGVPYLSWIYDGEDQGLYHTSITNDMSYIFTFDRAMLGRLLEKGVKHAWFMPLGVNAVRLDAISYREEDKAQFSGDISFVGNLYQNKGSLDNLVFSDYDRAFLEGILKAQVQINSDGNLLEELMVPELVKKVQEKLPKLDERYTLTAYDVVRNLMATAVTKRERFKIMSLLSERYPVDLYTFSDTSKLPKVKRRGVAGYFTTMPLVFRYSKINLNITHRMIMSGVPLRVMDVLGAGGFLMSDYQSDMEGIFRDGEHLAVYYSPEDLAEKAGFYLTHEEERKRIAVNGHALVTKEYTHEILLQKMFDTVGLRG